MGCAMYQLSKSPKQIAAESDAEMKLYDLLGPKAKQAIDSAPRQINIKLAIREFKLKPRPDSDWIDDCLPPIDLTDPAGDERFAKYLDDKIKQLCGKPIADFTINRRGTR
jgi:hypothetical protein